MLEPLAASVISTVFSARPFALPTSAQTAFKATTRASSSALPPNFFDPHPRRTLKGKEREHSGLPYSLYAEDDASKRCVGAAATTSVSADRSSGVLYSRRPRTRRLATNRSLSGSHADHIPRIGKLQQQSCSPQRRHASSLPGLVSHSGLGSDRHHRRLKQAIKGENVDLDDAWSSYEFLRLDSTLNTFTVAELLQFAERIANSALGKRRTPNIRWHRHHWGKRLTAILQDTQSRLLNAPSHSVLPGIWRCLMARALAFTDQMDEALALCHEINVEQVPQSSERHYIFLYQTILSVLSDRKGPFAAIRMLIDDWDNIKIYTPQEAPHEYYPGVLVAVNSFRNSLWEILREVDHIEQFFGSVDFNRPREWHERAGAFLMQTLCDRGFPADAAKIVKALYTRREEPPWRELMLVIKTLAKHKNFGVANALFIKAGQRLPSPDRRISSKSQPRLTDFETNAYHKTGLHLYAHQGNVAAATQCFDAVSPTRRASPADIALLIHAYALAKDAKGAVDIFEHYTSTRMLRPNVIHYTNVILAHAKSGDFAAVEEWTQKMAQAGCRPDDHVFSVIIQGFAERDDSESVLKILDWMRNMKQSLSAHAVTSVIALLARKKDFRGAEEMFNRAVEGGVSPDHQMVNAVMNAHVEAGNWAGITTTFDHLRAAAAQKRFPFTVGTFNTLLKAYVLAGAPSSIITTLRNHLKDLGLKPDAYTYSLLIQSACDNGSMAAAQSLYRDMQQETSSDQAYFRINVFVLTILMAGWLKKLNKKKAMAIYDSMLSQGIQPTSVTFYHIIKAYSDQRSQRSLDAAVAFLEELMGASSDKSWLTTSRSVRSGLDRVYGPLLTAYGRNKDPQKVEQLIEEMRSHGGQPSIGNFTSLLDAYRRAGDMEGVKKTWSRLFETATSTSASDSLVYQRDTQGQRSHDTALCVPLSIFIDATSSTGEHNQVTSVWKQVGEAGFSYDAHNWNQLALAAIRLGEPMRAFQIVERVLIPKQRKALALRGRHNPSAYETFDEFRVKEDDLETGTEGSGRAIGRRVVNTRMERRRLAYLMYKLRQSPPASSTPLDAMYKISPAWSDWGAQPQLLELLLESLEHLMAGGLVTHVPKGGGKPIPRNGTIDGKVYGQKSYALQNLKHIMTQSQNAVAVVLRWKNSTDRTKVTKVSPQKSTSLPLPQAQPSLVRPSLSRRVRTTRYRFVPHPPRPRVEKQKAILNRRRTRFSSNQHKAYYRMKGEQGAPATASGSGGS